MTYSILSCDGGGIRGYMTSRIIQALNEAADKLTGQREATNQIGSKVQAYAGTSTGGLISVGLSVGMTPEQLISIYRNDAAKIFTPNPIFDAADGGPGITICQYKASGLHDIMSGYTRDRKMEDLPSDILLAVNTAQLQDESVTPSRWSPITLNNHTVGPYAYVKLIDAALATSAAPTYFPPHLIPNMGYFADGGTFANNPLMNAIDVARQAKLISNVEDVQAISIGTGVIANKIPEVDIGNPLNWGVYSWMRPHWDEPGIPAAALLNMTMELSAINGNAIASALLGDGLIRLDPVLENPVALDSYDKAAYDSMDAAVDTLTNTPDFHKAAQMLAGWSDR